MFRAHARDGGKLTRVDERQLWIQLRESGEDLRHDLWERDLPVRFLRRIHDHCRAVAEMKHHRASRHHGIRLRQLDPRAPVADPVNGICRTIGQHRPHDDVARHRQHRIDRFGRRHLARLGVQGVMKIGACRNNSEEEAQRAENKMFQHGVAPRSV